MDDLEYAAEEGDESENLANELGSLTPNGPPVPDRLHCSTTAPRHTSTFRQRVNRDRILITRAGETD